MIEKMTSASLPHCIKLAMQLWPSATETELLEEYTAMNEDRWATFLYKQGKEYIGFISVSLRHDYVEGSSSSPVAFIEGIYVDENFRRKGIAVELIKAAEQWGMEKGCVEMGSDTELHNQLSIDFH